MSKKQRSIRCQFRRGDQEWAVMDDGHYMVFRAGRYAPGVIVTARCGRMAGRQGTVHALIPSWGGAVIINVVWEHRARDRRPPGVLWLQEDLDVIREAIS